MVSPRRQDEGNNARERERYDKVRDINIVVCSLIAAATFGAVLQIPGGYKSDGHPVFEHYLAFKIFLYADGVAFLFSLVPIVSLFWITYGRAPNRLGKKLHSPAGIFTFFSLLAALVSFLAAMFLLTQQIYPRVDAKSLTSVLVIILCVFAGSTAVCSYAFT